MRDIRIDYLKSFSIISVIILHSLTVYQRDMIGGAFYILQAVPIFMILTGYNSSKSISKKKNTVDEYYTKINIKYKLSRILVPYLMVYIVQIFLILFIKRESLGIESLVSSFILGGWGPGAYYTPLMIQVIFIIPLLVNMVKIKNKMSIVGVFILSCIFEAIVYYVGMPNDIYKICIVRYLFLIVLGIYLSNYCINKKVVYLLSGVSVLYIALVVYFDFNVLAQPDWGSQNIYAYFYPFMLVILVLNFKKVKNEKFNNICESIGSASFNIYLIQMTYFGFVGERIKGQIDVIFYVLMNIVICISVGLFFFKFENYIRKTLLNHRFT